MHRSLLDGFEWETSNILDWINIAQEAYRGFNPLEMDCQARIICEIHQNTKEFGQMAKSFVSGFRYFIFL